MKTILRILTVICLISLTSLVVLTARAQDIHFSQFKCNPLNISPALAGANHDIQISTIYKDQWRSVGSPFKTFGASADARLTDGRNSSGILVGGINFYSDKAGTSNMGTSFANFNLGYHVFLNKKSMLGMAVQAGYGQRSVEFHGLEWGSQYDGSSYNSAIGSGENNGSNSFGFFDLGSGLVYSYRSKANHVTVNDPFTVNVGIGVNHLLKPKYDFLGSGDNLYRRVNVFANSTVAFDNSTMGVEPSILYSRQGPTQEIIFGTYVSHLLKMSSKVTGFVNGSRIAMGFFYRTMDAFVLAARMDFGNFSAGMSYDLNLSNFTAATKGRGGFEISLRYVTPNPFGTINRSRL